MNLNLIFNRKVKALVLFLLIFLTNESFSQSRYNSVYKNKLILGLNIVDDSFSKTNNAFNYDQQWNIAAYPSYFGYNYVVSENISVEGVFTLNKYSADKLVDGIKIPTGQDYYAFDINAKYNLSNLIYSVDKLSNFEPFIAIGGGFTSIDSKSRPTINYGFGTYIWFNKYENKCCSESIFNNLGLIFQTMGKSSLDQKTYGNQIQHTFGVVYRF